jgi:guanine nucleotide-binding protein subunit alpha
MAYARQTWNKELTSWRTVVHLNLIRSVNAILDTLEGAPETASQMDLLRERLAPLRRAQHDLELSLKSKEGREEVQAATDAENHQLPAAFDAQSCSRRVAAVGLASQRTRSPGRRSLADEALETILNSHNDIATLWKNDAVRAALEARGLRLEEQSAL